MKTEVKAADKVDDFTSWQHCITNKQVHGVKPVWQESKKSAGRTHFYDVVYPDGGTQQSGLFLPSSPKYSIIELPLCCNSPFSNDSWMAIFFAQQSY